MKIRSLWLLSIFPNTDGFTVVIPKKHYHSGVLGLPEKVLHRFEPVSLGLARSG